MAEDLALLAFESLRRAGKTFSAAESCTGGLIGKRITDLSGSSGVYPGGLIVYSDFAKARLLGVPETLLEREGAVSRPVAVELAERVRALMETDYGVGVTGLAGPDSDASGKPVGLIFVSVSNGDETVCSELHLGADRAENRRIASDEAFRLLLTALGRSSKA